MFDKKGWVLALAMLAACNGGPRSALHPNGSTTAVAVDHGRDIVAVNVLEGSISRMEVDTGKVEELILGEEPSRVAPFGDRVLVSLRGERAVAVVDISGETMKVEKMLQVGAEPFGIVSDFRSKHFYVAISQGNEVLEFDKDLEVVRRFKVPDQPRWLALHPSGKQLYVVSARNGTATQVELETGDLTSIEPPTMVRPTDMDDGLTDLDHRWTGDPTVTPKGDWLVIPGIHADTTTPVETPTDDRPVANGYGSSSGGSITIGRINPSVVAFPLDRGGALSLDEPPIVLFVASLVNRRDLSRSYPTSVTADPEGGQIAITMEASNSVILADLRPFKGQDSGEDVAVMQDFGTFTTDGEGNFLRPAFPAEGGFTDRPIVGVEVAAAGPDGVVFLENDVAWVHNFIDRTLSQLPYELAEDNLNESAENRFVQPLQRRASFGQPLTQPSLPTDVELGLRLFYGATDSRMAADGAGVSCSTCHVDGRDDGFTWTFDKGVRQTPSLAGVVSETAPVTWTDSVDSVATEAELTSSLRMGGDGISAAEAEAIQAFVDYGRDVDVQRAPSAAVARGKAVFERADVGCADCHSGERLTDNQSHELFELAAVNTPSLTGLAATAPYLHDGSARDLEALLLVSDAGLMGDTSMLNDAERSDLLRYLESL